MPITHVVRSKNLSRNPKTNQKRNTNSKNIQRVPNKKKISQVKNLHKHNKISSKVHKNPAKL